MLEWVRPHYPRLGLIGFSLGAAIAINTVSQQPEGVQTVVAVSGPAAFDDIEFKWWTPEAWRTGLDGCEAGVGCRPGNLLLKKLRPVEQIRRFRQLPLLIIHGTRDVIVGVEHCRRLYEAAPQPKGLEIIEGGSHAEALFRDDPERFTQLVIEWFSTTL